MQTVEDAIQLAVEVHQGQKDKAGSPYILHSLRVMLSMATETEMIVAVLHDVVEDKGITIDDLRKAGYSEEITDAIDCLIRRDGEEYDELIDRVKSNPRGVKGKIADLRDNSNLDRIAEPKENDYNRFEKYGQALAELAKV